MRSAIYPCLSVKVKGFATLNDARRALCLLVKTCTAVLCYKAAAQLVVHGGMKRNARERLRLMDIFPFLSRLRFATLCDYTYFPQAGEHQARRLCVIK